MSKLLQIPMLFDCLASCLYQFQHLYLLLLLHQEAAELLGWTTEKASGSTSSRKIPSPGLRQEVGLRLSKMNPKPGRFRFCPGHFFSGLGHHWCSRWYLTHPPACWRWCGTRPEGAGHVQEDQAGGQRSNIATSFVYTNFFVRSGVFSRFSLVLHTNLFEDF